jgi:hypothetical protein
MVRRNPRPLAVDPGVIAARGAALKLMLGWDDRQCGEALAKYPDIIVVHYANQYVCLVIGPVGKVPRSAASRWPESPAPQ